MRSLRTLIVAAFTIALAACSGNNSPLCTTVPLQNIATPQLVYPVPGYKKVPDSAPAMVVAYTASPLLAQTITIKPDNQGAVSLGAFGAAPKPLPTPYVQHPTNGGTLYGVTMPKLEAHTHYTVAYKYVSSAGLCGQSTESSIPMGDFTTL
jgi:hypothetical protein